MPEIPLSSLWKVKCKQFGKIIALNHHHILFIMTQSPFPMDLSKSIGNKEQTHSFLMEFTLVHTEKR